MRIAIVSDIHGNLTALEAVSTDLLETAPDLVLHGGDLPHGGSRPAEVVDMIRDLGWKGVLGNTDEMLFDPSSLTDFAAQQQPEFRWMFDIIGEMAADTVDRLGSARIEWLRSLPRTLDVEGFRLVHATATSTWRAPNANASDEDLDAAYATPVVYGHIHHPFIRVLANKTVVNSGSVGLPYDGDCRASYLLVDDGHPTIRRVAYDVKAEIAAVSQAKIPYAEWTVSMLAKAAPTLPERQ